MGVKQIIVKSKGKKYIVNVPWFDDIGSVISTNGELLITNFIWLKYEDNYYRIGLETDGGIVNYFVEQSPGSPSEYFFNYITLSLNGYTYKVELVFDDPVYTLSVEQTPISETAMFSSIVLMNITDTNSYSISLADDGELIGLAVSQEVYV